MVKVVWFRFQQCLLHLTCHFPKGPRKGDFLEIWLTTYFGVHNLGNASAMRRMFFLKSSKFNLAFKNAETNSENAFNVLTNILKTLHITKRQFFPTQLPSQWSMNMVKVVRFRFQQCWLPLTFCFTKGFMKRDFLEIWLTTFYVARNFGNTSALRMIFFSKCSKFNIDFKNAETNWENVFCFWDICIWIGCLKLSLLRREYLWSAVNMLTNILKTLHITERSFFKLNCFHSDQ